MLFLTCLLLISVIALYQGMRLWLWTLSVLAIFGIAVVSADYHPAIITLAFVAAAILLILTLPFIRRQLISNTVFQIFKRQLPPMSETERTALNAGDTWWDAELFTGRPNWKALLETPQPELTEAEVKFIEGPASKLCELIDDWEITHHRRRLPNRVWKFIKDEGFLGMIIPKKYGGLEFSALAHSRIVMMLASRSVSAAVSVMVPNSLGPAELLLKYGTDKQKNHYLPRLANGTDIPCFALTAPEAGSDASAIPDKGIVCYGKHEGQDVLGIRLNWRKRYITLGPIATLLGLAFQLEDPEGLLGETPDIGITCALIPTNTPGVQIGRRHYPMNQAFQNGPNEGHNVFIPMDWVIGGQEQVGKGWQMLMECLAAGRAISLPSLSVSGAKLASRAAGAYARIREQFGMPIGEFEGIEGVLARIASKTYTMDATRIMTLGALDRGHHPAVISAMVKQQLTEGMRVAINDAMDIQGGAGISMGPRNIFARIYQALPISITVEGANILTRNFIIFGQGAIRCHPYLFKEISATEDSSPRQGLKQFDDAFFSHIGLFLQNAVRSFWLGLTNGRTAHVPVQGAAFRYLQQLNRMSAAFAFVSDSCLLLLGSNLKRKEHLSARLADVFSLLYLTSATIKHFEANGTLDSEVPLLKTACHNAFYEMQESLHGVLRNIPNRMIGLILRFIVFPRGRSYSAPYDEFLHDTAALLLTPSTVRDRLTQGIFLSQNPDAQIYRLEQGLIKVTAAYEAEKKLKWLAKQGKIKRDKNIDVMINEAIQETLLNDEEIRLIKDARNARLDVIEVDDFDPELGLSDDHEDTPLNMRYA